MIIPAIIEEALQKIKFTGYLGQWTSATHFGKGGSINGIVTRGRDVDQAWIQLNGLPFSEADVVAATMYHFPATKNDAEPLTRHLLSGGQQAIW